MYSRTLVEFFMYTSTNQLIPTPFRDGDPKIHSGSFTAQVVMCDISGFTAMTEQYFSKGRDGAEALSRILDTIFGDGAQLVQEYEGFIPYFAGDAFYAIFADKPNREPINTEAFWFALRQIILSIPSIKIKGGYGIGNVQWKIIGTTYKRWVFSGEALTMSNEDLGHAIPDAALNIQTLNYTPKYPCFGYLKASEVWPIQQLETFGATEFRVTTTLFCKYSGKNEDAFEPYFMKAVHQNDGYVKELDFSEKGNLGVAFFGAPLSTLDKLYAAAYTAEKLHLWAVDHNLKLQIGLCTGNTFCGLVGGDAFRQYIVLGRTVNLAARLCVAANNGQTMLDKATAQSNRINAIPNGFTKAKGLKMPVKTYDLQGVRQAAQLSYFEPYNDHFEQINNLLYGPEEVITSRYESGLPIVSVALQLNKHIGSDFPIIQPSLRPLSGLLNWLEMDYPKVAAQLNESLATINTIKDLDRFAEGLPSLLNKYIILKREGLIWIQSAEGESYSWRVLKEWQNNTERPFWHIIFLEEGVAMPKQVYFERISNEAIKSYYEEAFNKPIAPEAMEFLLRETGSRPAIVRRVGDWAWDNGWITLKDDVIVLGATYSSEHSFLLTLYDMLAPHDKEYLKTSAILKNGFLMEDLIETQAALSPNIEPFDQNIIIQQGFWYLPTSATETGQGHAYNLHSMNRQFLLALQLPSQVLRKHKQAANVYKKGTKLSRAAYHFEYAKDWVNATYYYKEAGKLATSWLDYESALDLWRTGRELAREHKLPSQEIKCIMLSAGVLLNLGRWDEAQIIITEGEDVLHEIDSDYLSGRFALLQARLAMHKGLHEDAQTYLSQATSSYTSSEDEEGMWRKLLTEGQLMFREGNYAGAKQILQRALEEAGNQDVSGIVIFLSLAEMNMGAYDSALTRLQRFMEETTLTDSQLSAIEIYTGVIYNESQQPDLAIPHLERGLKLAEEHQQKQQEAIALGTLGQALIMVHQYEKAMPLIEKDLQICEELGDRQGIAIAIYLKAAVKEGQKDWKEAELLYKESLDRAEWLNYQKGVLKAYNGLIRIYENTNRQAMAQELQEKSIKLASDIQYKGV